MNNRTRVITTSEFTGKNSREVFDLLKNSGYQPCKPLFMPFSMKDYKDGLKQEPDRYQDGIDLLNTEKDSIPFILRNENGSIIDEYDYVRAVYWINDPPVVIKNEWVHVGSPAVIYPMPLDEKNAAVEHFNDLHVSDTLFVMTDYNIRCYEKAFSEYCHLMDQQMDIVSLSNGRYAVGILDGMSHDSWFGYPACGDGNMEKYKRYLSVYGSHEPMLFATGKDDPMTFPSASEAEAWAKEKEIPLTGKTV